MGFQGKAGGPRINQADTVTPAGMTSDRMRGKTNQKEEDGRKEGEEEEGDQGDEKKQEAEGKRGEVNIQSDTCERETNRLECRERKKRERERPVRGDVASNEERKRRIIYGSVCDDLNQSRNRDWTDRRRR